MEAVSEYTEQAEKFLADHELIFSAVHIGEDCPPFCEDAAKGKALDQIGIFPRKTHIHGSHWRCTLQRKGAKVAGFTVDFWDSYHHAEIRAIGTEEYRRNNGSTFGKYGKQVRGERVEGGVKRTVFVWPKAPKPTAYDVLACIEKNDPGTFEDFCGDFGYDTDSRRAFEVYMAMQEQYSKLSRFLTAKELQEVREIN